MEPLTIETLSKASRTVTNLLSELRIRCEFSDRGCEEYVELGSLERHLKECGYAPAVCCNEGCRLEMNKQDLFHHETVVCKLREVQCHNCDHIRQEMDAVKVNLAALNEKLGRNEKKLDRNEKKLDRNEAKFENVKAVVENVVAKVDLIQEQLNNREVNNRLVQEDMKKSLNEITKQLERMAQKTSHKFQAKQDEMNKKGIAEADDMNREPKVVIVGNVVYSTQSDAVELFNISDGTWTPLQPMRKQRYGHSAVVYNNQLVVVGGSLKSMEKLSLNALQTDLFITCEHFPAELPVSLTGHSSVVYKGRLIVIGGFDTDKNEYSDRITQISLAPPYTSKIFATMPQGIIDHGVVLFGDKIVIVGGSNDFARALAKVVMYDITRNECQELAPLPYPVYEMATVKWGDDNIIIIGGADSQDKPLSKVLVYNIKTQKSHLLPDMKCQRRECAAVVIRDTVIVMGGKDENGDPLKSVESFTFDRFTWEELQEMNDAKWGATAVVC
jgi:N-acetylneuraminic acid mutarotase/ribosome-associated translation inhibitor RaiA